MFQCDHCKSWTKPGERMQTRDAKVRTVHYLRPGNNSIGQELVEEQSLCTECAKVLADTPPEIVGQKYVEFPSKEAEADRDRSEMPTNTIMARWPKNWSRIRKRLRRERMRARDEEA